ncbi:hypothetical protein WGT02_36500 (plasmid) [Rhizobium sp. T1470]|uniref:hypothetical protein n=1 Tax=Rhizobium sp. T1470 TaxID=555320 RepID=UPI000423AB21
MSLDSPNDRRSLKNTPLKGDVFHQDLPRFYSETTEQCAQDETLSWGAISGPGANVLL